MNLAKGAKVTALDSIEAPPRWRQSNLVDGVYPGAQDASGGKKLDQLIEQRTELLAKVLDRDLKLKVDANERALASVAAELSKISPPNVVYAGTVHHGSGNFLGTGANGGKPRTIHVLHRGDVKNPKEEVTPGTLQCIPGLLGEFNLPADHSEGDRRAALAKWLSDQRNPLTWRSIVNRAWQYHFGHGLVDTPNDFGRMRVVSGTTRPTLDAPVPVRPVGVAPKTSLPSTPLGLPGASPNRLMFAMPLAVPLGVKPGPLPPI